MNKLLNILTCSLLVVCVLAFNYACTEYDTPAEIADDGTIDTGISTKIHRKVLWINIDGAVGEVVKNSLPADGAIAKMLKNSKYSCREERRPCNVGNHAHWGHTRKAQYNR